MKILLSKRDRIENFDPEYKVQFSHEFNATSLAKELYYLGYKDEKSLATQFKERNYEVNSVVKQAIKDVIADMKKKENVGYKK